MYEVTALIAVGKTAITLMKSLKDAATTMKNTELGGIIIDLQSAMMEMQQEQQNLINENVQLNEENRKLADKISINQNLEFHYNSYWIRKEDKSLDGPFSQTMKDVEDKLVRMKFHSKKNYSGIEKYDFYYEKSAMIRNANEHVLVPAEFIHGNKVPIRKEQ